LPPIPTRSSTTQSGPRPIFASANAAVSDPRVQPLAGLRAVSLGGSPWGGPDRGGRPSRGGPAPICSGKQRRLLQRAVRALLPRDAPARSMSEFKAFGVAYCKVELRNGAGPWISTPHSRSPALLACTPRSDPWRESRGPYASAVDVDRENLECQLDLRHAAPGNGGFLAEPSCRIWPGPLRTLLKPDRWNNEITMAPNSSTVPRTRCRADRQRLGGSPRRP